VPARTRIAGVVAAAAVAAGAWAAGTVVGTESAVVELAAAAAVAEPVVGIPAGGASPGAKWCYSARDTNCGRREAMMGARKRRYCDEKESVNGTGEEDVMLWGPGERNGSEGAEIARNSWVVAGMMMPKAGIGVEVHMKQEGEPDGWVLTGTEAALRAKPGTVQTGEVEEHWGRVHTAEQVAAGRTAAVGAVVQRIAVAEGTTGVVPAPRGACIAAAVGVAVELGRDSVEPATGCSH
jgi:hypothetical protein